VIKKILGLISPKDLAHEENSRLPRPMASPSAGSAQDVMSGDGTMRRFWVESGVLKDLENPEISLSLADIGDAIADAAEYY
jgi:hypothetical protein